MELREALGEELFSQVEAKLTEINNTSDRKDNPVRYVDLSEGAYVGKENYTRLQTESAGYKKQLEDANGVIKSYKDMDIDGIKQSAKDWETKYTEDTKKLQEQLASQERTFAAERYLDGQKIKSPLSRKTILQEFLSQNMEFKDGKFAGADDYMKKVREQYPDEFEAEVQTEEPKKVFTRATSHTYKPTTRSEEEAYLKKKYGNNKYSKK
ncbi:phage scaffolding protein [Sporofaciens musculi]|uniref:phage scaffolding protein n=1 Tax=Sporofaciens musculi TaxID=2681861 RepID=UPI00259D169B|nr:phage scaffolding protein [Sporofaciens musculi]